MQEPLPDFVYEQLQVLRIATHDLVELGVFAGSEEHPRQAEPEILFVQAESAEQSL